MPNPIFKALSDGESSILSSKVFNCPLCEDSASYIKFGFNLIALTCLVTLEEKGWISC